MEIRKKRFQVAESMNHLLLQGGALFRQPLSIAVLFASLAARVGQNRGVGNIVLARGGAMKRLSDPECGDGRTGEAEGLARELAFFRQALWESSLLVITDNDGVILEVNDRFCELCGYAREELVGSTHGLLKSGAHDAAFFSHMWATLRAGKVWRGEICNRAKNGNLYWAYVTIVPFLDEQGEPVRHISVRTDITERKKAEEQAEAERARRVLTERFASLGEVAAGVAHELFNPLAAIRGRMELLQIQADREILDKDKVRQAAQTAIALLDRMTQIIRAMRQLGRDAGQDPFRPVSVAALLDEAVEFVGMRFKRSGVEVEVDPLPEGLVVVCRETQILQVLLNLVQNAFDAVVGRVGGAIRLRVESVDNRVRFLVLDSGPGVPEGLVDRIFNPFFTTKEQGKGTGLGLSLSHSIALQHGGTLRYEPRDGMSCFVLNLPKVQGSDPSPPAPLPPILALA